MPCRTRRSSKKSKSSTRRQVGGASARDIRDCLDEQYEEYNRGGVPIVVDRDSCHLTLFPSEVNNCQGHITENRYGRGRKWKLLLEWSSENGISITNYYNGDEDDCEENEDCEDLVHVFDGVMQCLSAQGLIRCY